MLGGLIVFSLFFGLALSHKLCTNSGVLSHTARYQRFLSNNSSREKQDVADLHLMTTDDQTWSTLIPRKMLLAGDEISWNAMHRKMKNVGGERGRGNGGGFLKEISLHDVRLEPKSIHGVAQQTNLEYLLMLDVDRLVWSFRRTAGLEAPGEPYGGWEAPDVELRGHFVGHYLSASALMWASTHNGDLRKKMSSVVSALSDCQNKIGTGYLSAFPSELFDRFETLHEVWAPYYTIHKILAGLLDQYTMADSARALQMMKWMVDYFYNRVQKVIKEYTIERHWLSLNEETGGMNDILYRLYSVTGDQKHLALAHLFDKPCFLGLLAVKADDISGFHSNTHIPIVVGSQRRYEITGDPLYKEIGTYFMDIVNSSHSYATGGTSVDEFWSDPKRLANTLKTENQESCTTYNMLKVSRHLFMWTKKVVYADYYEKALTNGVLGIQRGKDPGVMIYMYPLHPGGSKAQSYHGWGTKFDSFWCCYGTGIESFSKFGDSIYFEEEGEEKGLYIIQYIPSTLHWRSGQVRLSQRVEPVVSWDQRLQVTVSISSKTQAEVTPSTLNLRIPSWISSSGSEASLNGQNLSVPASGNFVSISKSWILGDKIELRLPLSLRTEAIQDDRPNYASLQAFLYGPYLLAGFSKESDELIKMEKSPEVGTDAALRATFRLVVKNSNSECSPASIPPIGKSVMLELFDFPGKFVLHNGEGKSLSVSNSSSMGKQSSVFRLVAGLDGKDGTISLESKAPKGCFVYRELSNDSGASVKLKCGSGTSDTEFQRASSFVLKDGVSKYHAISFIAKGVRRNFILSPLFSFIDESYTVYFNTSM
ncbi:hypothetical protein AAHA92_24070 [Salvia divinorum]|uniref:Alpha-L-arabinofuranosidase B arabinose-binding domain-containing protein n=1 Tax=Salvia divinorum TaxID=28513 RepID=A0ABD1G663_SALDI